MNPPALNPRALFPSNAPPDPVQPRRSVARVIFAVPGLPRAAASVLSCCSFPVSFLVTEALQALPGVRMVEVDERRGRVTVAYDAATLAIPDFRRALAGAGFPAEAHWAEAAT